MYTARCDCCRHFRWTPSGPRILASSYTTSLGRRTSQKTFEAPSTWSSPTPPSSPKRYAPWLVCSARSHNGIIPVFDSPGRRVSSGEERGKCRKDQDQPVYRSPTNFYSTSYYLLLLVVREMTVKCPFAFSRQECLLEARRGGGSSNAKQGMQLSATSYRSMCRKLTFHYYERTVGILHALHQPCFGDGGRAGRVGFGRASTHREQKNGKTRIAVRIYSHVRLLLL